MRIITVFQSGPAYWFYVWGYWQIYYRAWPKSHASAGHNWAKRVRICLLAPNKVSWTFHHQASLKMAVICLVTWYAILYFDILKTMYFVSQVRIIFFFQIRVDPLLYICQDNFRLFLLKLETLANNLIN